MVLIALLIVLGVERVAATSSYWQFEFYFRRYFSLMERSLGGDFTKKEQLWKLALWLLAPAAIAWLVFANIRWGLLETLLVSVSLLIIVGCSTHRNWYRNYLQASNRGDTEASLIYAEKLGQNINDPSDTLGKALVRFNFIHYFGALFWFVFLSIPGALLYMVLHKFVCRLEEEQRQKFAILLHVIDWLPARVMTLGFIFVGNFSKAISLWLSYLFDLKTSNRHVVTEVAKAAEYVEPELHDCTEEPCTMVRLVKRNILFFLSVISVLTLYGWLQ